MSSIFDLSPNLTLLPVLHGSGDFALEVRRRILAGAYDCLGVPLPPAFEDGVEEAVDHLPGIHIVAQREGGLSTDPTAYTYVPIDPCQPVIAAIRTARKRIDSRDTVIAGKSCVTAFHVSLDTQFDRSQSRDSGSSGQQPKSGAFTVAEYV